MVPPLALLCFSMACIKIFVQNKLSSTKIKSLNQNSIELTPCRVDCVTQKSFWFYSLEWIKILMDGNGIEKFWHISFEVHTNKNELEPHKFTFRFPCSLLVYYHKQWQSMVGSRWSMIQFACIWSCPTSSWWW